METSNPDNTASSDDKAGTEAKEEAEPQWVELEQPKDGNVIEIEDSGLNGDNMFIAEVDINTKGWQIVANTTS